MRVLVVGSGAREHALCWRLAQEDGVRVWAAPGNDGMRAVARCVAVAQDDGDGLADVAQREGIDLVVVGPEAPLAAGVADALRAVGLAVLGPSAAAARIEASKSWARRFCQRHGIPAPGFAVASTPQEARAVAARWPLPAVCKADGLMAGKGVTVAMGRQEALAAAEALAARGPVVFEEFVEGVELSAFALCDGRSVCYLGEARDHKRLLAGHRGPMTGGMGAFAPVPDVDPHTRKALQAMLCTALEGLAAEGYPFIGFLFAGLMLTADGPRLLEFNCRLGDPEAQALLPRWSGPLAEPWLAAARGALPRDGGDQVATGATVGVVMAGAGYPGPPGPAQPIAGLAPDGTLPGALCFHGATTRRGETWLAAGGRVLTVVGRGVDLGAARAAAYAACGRVRFEGAQWREDIGVPLGQERAAVGPGPVGGTA
jgi:phosphoribosylamine--glycine ligase